VTDRADVAVSTFSISVVVTFWVPFTCLSLRAGWITLRHVDGRCDGERYFGQVSLQKIIHGIVCSPDLEASSKAEERDHLDCCWMIYICEISSKEQRNWFDSLSRL
jgi:hypothetical protein